MADYILALDQGTTSSRAIIFDAQGNIVQIAQREFTQYFPRSGWVEHDAIEIWSTQSGVIAEVLVQARLESQDIAAIGITNQRETTVVWEKDTGKPIHPAIVWQDRRTAGMIDTLKQAEHTEMIQAKTGLLLDAYFSASKLAWLLENVAGARQKAEAGKLLFGTIDTWLLYNLTGGSVHATDVSNASRTMLFNIHSLAWDEEILELFKIPAVMLPEVGSSSQIYGETNCEVLRTSIPIAGIAGDQQAASFGQACFDEGMGKNTYGTGCFMLMNTGATVVQSKNKLLGTVAWQYDLPSSEILRYALEGSIFIGGAVVQWLRDGLGVIKKSEDIEALAASEPDNGGVYLVPAFVGLGAPHWDSYARGSMFGLTRANTAGHIARAALEGIAYQVVDVVQAMEKDSGIVLEELRVDGGASRNDLLMQFQADMLGVPVVRPKVTETTALGAAFLAGLAVDMWQSTTELADLWQEDKRFMPKITEEARAVHLAMWQKAVARSVAWAEG